MEMNLRTTLQAYPKLASSLLADYVTKEELAAKDYVNNSSLTETLSDYVTDVVGAEDSIIYGRQDVNGTMMWVPAASTEEVNQPLRYGMLQSTSMDAAKIHVLSKAILAPNTTTYTLEYQPSVNGYFWFCYPKEIRRVTSIGGFTYDLELIKQSSTVPYSEDSTTFNMKCYRTTDELVAIAGVPYRLEITIGE